MQQVDTDPPSLPVGTEVSAKYKGAFCEAKVSKVVRNIKVKVAYKQGLGSGIVSDDLIKIATGQLRVGATVEVRHPDRKDFVEGTVTKIQDCSQYTVVFDDGDITTLRRTALCLKSGRHFNESETLDQLPLTHPEHFGNPVVGGRRGRRRGQLNDDSSDDEDESDTKEIVNEKEEHIGKVVCVEMETKKKDKDKWFPGLILAPTAQANIRIRVKDEYLVRSFKDGRYYTVPKKETTEFTREAASKQDGQAVQAALEYLDSGILPPHWDRESLFGLNNSSSEGDGELESDSSDDEPREEKDRFVAQLYKYMDDRGTPLNKVPSIQNRDVDLYRLFRAVQKCGGYNRVTAKNQWKSIAIRLGFTPVTVSVTNLVKQAFKKFLQPYGEFHRKLGCSMLMTPRNCNRSKGRSLVRANSVASPKPVDVNKDSSNKSIITPTSVGVTPTPMPTPTPTAAASVNTNTNVVPSSSSLSSVSSSQNITSSPAVPTTTTAAINVTVTTRSIVEESETTSESSLDTAKNKRKVIVGKVKGLVEKYEEKSKDDGDVPLSKIKQAAAADLSRIEDKEKDIKESKDISPPVSSHQRESSPPGTSSGNKKDKNPQKKQTPQSDDKRNKRKKDDTIEKVDAGDFVVEVGDKLKVYYHEKKVTYEAKVIEISVQRGTPMYLVHYTGWNNRYDEWVPRERIAENITKGSKQKGRMSNFSSTDKPKENPSKPPSGPSLNASGPPNSMLNLLSSTPSSSKNTMSAKRGRGRSDSLPPRSTTPSSVASNSSRTKSPATAGPKRRPVRSMVSSTRRTSANVSDVSLQSESETDSDEPVRRPTRGAKSGSMSGKVTAKNKLSVSAGNSQSDTDGDDEDGDPATISRAKSGSTNSINSKGRNYDLSQIRSELRGFQGLKSPSPSMEGDVEIDKKDIKGETSAKDESMFDTKSCISENKKLAEISTDPVAVKIELKTDIKDENVKSSTDMSSETESFCDDDSQSSGKTTTLENMTKKFQQKIKAGRQHALEKLTSGKSTVERVPRVVEKIIQDSLAEKLQESLKTKPDEDLQRNPSDTVICKSFIDKKDESKKTSTQSNESLQKATANSQTRFSNTSSSSKFPSVIVEKPTASTKKNDSTVNKKTDVTKKAVTDNLESHSKVVIKEISKNEPSAACSPSSSSSSSSSSTSVSSRSLPDMSKLDISGGSSSTSSSSSSYTISNKEAKILSVTPKATSHDIYEFKDPEPFEFEIRKMPTTSTNSSSLIAISGSTSTSPRKPNQKIGVHTVTSEKQQQNQSPIAALINRKKRGSPMKEATVDKTKIIKTEEKTSIVSDGKLKPMTSTISTVTKTSLANQTKLMNLNINTSLQSQCSSTSTTPKASDISKPTPFDALRKSPNFNVNINALNEELAQTVQETTRALTDAFQSPTVSSPPEVSDTSPKLESKEKENDIDVLITPPRKSAQPNASASTSSAPPKKVIGSPFVETKKDLSNVFELSTGEGSASTSESKDNKFEFENAKKMLSATTCSFDLDPSKYENKPTSIADKLLKAINQKKEEDKQKVDPKNDKPDKVDETKKVTNDIATIIATNLSDCLSQKLGSISIEPLNVNTDLGGSTLNYLNNGNNYIMEKLPVISSLNKPTPLTSPEPKLGILESITVKNNDLTETIQKLECAIQRRTPVAGLSVTTTPTSSLAPNTFSEDSMDSTDSERRLVIEDVAEEMCDMLKSPSAGLQQIGELKTLSRATISQKTENVNTKVMPSSLVSPSDSVQTLIPAKALQPSRSQACTTTTVSFQNTTTSTTTAPLSNKIPESCTTTHSMAHTIFNVAQQTKSGHQEAFEKRDSQNDLKPKLGGDHKAINAERKADIELCYGAIISANDNINTKPFESIEVPTSISMKISKQQIQNSANVVPIVVPDIPVSVVVASGAVPSVKAAAQAAAAAAASKNQPMCKPTIQADLKFGATTITTATSTIPIPSPSSVVSCRTTTSSASTGKIIEENIKNNITSWSVNDITLKSSKEVALIPQMHGISSNSGFYLDARTELRPEDGVKPLLENQQRTGRDVERFEIKSNIRDGGGEGGLSSEEFTSNLGIDANSESINLLCEETIPGSPAPVFGGKEESLPTPLTSEHCLIIDNERKDYVNTPTVPRTGVSLTNINSSPNDSASQDESSEDIKKNVGIENEISSRKRRRTRKQSEVAMIAEHSSKRRKQMSCLKKLPGGSDSDENSDAVSQRSNVTSRQQFQQQLQQLQQTSARTRPCPYNFLVQLDPNMDSEQSIAIILKQIQELRKTYNTIKGDLASIDRRRKKLRRREREKKQLVQNQQVKIP